VINLVIVEIKGNMDNNLGMVKVKAAMAINHAIIAEVALISLGWVAQ
jgi:hypothetical protein